MFLHACSQLSDALALVSFSLFRAARLGYGVVVPGSELGGLTSREEDLTFSSCLQPSISSAYKRAYVLLLSPNIEAAAETLLTAQPAS